MNKNGRFGPFSFLKNTFRLFRIKIQKKYTDRYIFIYLHYYSALCRKRKRQSIS